MFLGPTIIEYLNSLAFTLKGYSDSRLFTHGDNCGNVHDEMATKLLVASTTSYKMRLKKARGRLRQSEVFFPLAYHAIVANRVVQQGISNFLSRIAQVFDREIVVLDKKCGGSQYCLCR